MPDASTPEAFRPNPHARRWRVAALVLLVLGILGAGVDYWMVSRSQVDMDDPSMLSFNKKTNEQMGRLFGKSGGLVEDLQAGLEKPGVQAGLIFVVSGLAAWGCLMFSRLPAADPADDVFKHWDKKRTD